MTSHELAKKLLEGPDEPVVICGDDDEYFEQEANGILSPDTLSYYNEQGEQVTGLAIELR